MITLGLVPALWAHGAGAEAIQRIAAPMIGGLITSIRRKFQINIIFSNPFLTFPFYIVLL